MTVFVFMLAIIGCCGLLHPKNIISFLMSIEILILAATTHLIEGLAQGVIAIESSILLLFMLIVAGAELAIGLALVMRAFKNHDSLCIDSFHKLKE